ncbi:MAG: hypothetical protein KGO96_14050 [Elusimicrobia bacterium]|nr:hypothetical protein [Elusimicrobiota bacterium]
MSAPKVDVLAVIRKHAEAHRALAGSDAYSAQEAPKLEATLAAVAELIEAAKRLEKRGFFDDVPYSPDVDLAAMKAALARIGSAP